MSISMIGFAARPGTAVLRRAPRRLRCLGGPAATSLGSSGTTAATRGRNPRSPRNSQPPPCSGNRPSPAHQESRLSGVVCVSLTRTPGSCGITDSQTRSRSHRVSSSSMPPADIAHTTPRRSAEPHPGVHGAAIHQRGQRVVVPPRHAHTHPAEKRTSCPQGAPDRSRWCP